MKTVKNLIKMGVASVALLLIVSQSLFAAKPKSMQAKRPRSAAGVLPYIVENGTLYFLMGKEKKRGFSDFGGWVDKRETLMQAAARECEEESSGYFQRNEIAKKINDDYAASMDDGKRFSFRLYFADVSNITTKAGGKHQVINKLTQNLSRLKKQKAKSTYTEKSAFKWFSIEELKNSKEVFADLKLNLMWGPAAQIIEKIQIKALFNDNQKQEDINNEDINNNNNNSQKWSCPTCTFDNTIKDKNCLMCGTKQNKKQKESTALKPTKKKIKAKKDQKKNKQWSCSMCTLYNKIIDKRCVACGTAKKLSENKNKKKWDCKMCTFSNDSSNQKCEICNSGR